MAVRRRRQVQGRHWQRTQPDLYQLLAYATATQLRAATLVYADGPPTPRSHNVSDRGTVLHVRHLNLDQPPDRVLRDLRGLANDIRAADEALQARPEPYVDRRGSA